MPSLQQSALSTVSLLDNPIVFFLIYIFIFYVGIEGEMLRIVLFVQWNLKARLLFCLLVTIIDFEYKKFIDLQYKFWMNAAGNQVFLITLCHHCERQK